MGHRIRSRAAAGSRRRSEEHTSELQSRSDLVCRLLLEKKKSSPTCARSPGSAIARGPHTHAPAGLAPTAQRPWRAPGSWRATTAERERYEKDSTIPPTL